MNSFYSFRGGRLHQRKVTETCMGIILQQNLGWHKHYDSISAKAYVQTTRFTPPYFFIIQLSLYQEETIPVTGSLTAIVLLTTMETNDCWL